MLINEVYTIVGLSKKSIRMYEEYGLIKPKRNAENDYRIYDEEIVKQLKVIKFLRELGVPLKELKSLCDKKMTLEECLVSRIKKIDDETEKYKCVKKMCEDIIEEKMTIEDIDITEYFQGMNKLGKEGFTLRDTKKNNNKKILGACLSTLIFGLLFMFIPVIITFFQFTEAEKMPWIVYTFLMVLFLIPFIGMIVNLIKRIKEIKGGEEDEASKY